MKKTLSILMISVLCLMTGCLSLISTKKPELEGIDGEIECCFRVGKNAAFLDHYIDTDATFDKDKFVELYNENSKYDPNHLKYNLDECDLKINAEEQPDEFDKIDRTETCIEAKYGGKSRHVSVFRYEGKLYFFVLCMGSRSEPDEVGYYYIELSDEMSKYWSPIFEQVSKDAEKYYEDNYGSFTTETAFSYDRKYYAQAKKSGDNIIVYVHTVGDNKIAGVFFPCRKVDFWGICWANDSYDLWVQSSDIGTVCYSRSDDGNWELNEGAVKPDYIIGRHG